MSNPPRRSCKDRLRAGASPSDPLKAAAFGGCSPARTRTWSSRVTVGCGAWCTSGDWRCVPSAGFEPASPPSEGGVVFRWTTRACGGSPGTRTPHPSLKRRLLWPDELATRGGCRIRTCATLPRRLPFSRRMPCLARPILLARQRSGRRRSGRGARCRTWFGHFIRVPHGPPYHLVVVRGGCADRTRAWTRPGPRTSNPVPCRSAGPPSSCVPPAGVRTCTPSRMHGFEPCASAVPPQGPCSWCAARRGFEPRSPRPERGVRANWTYGHRVVLGAPGPGFEPGRADPKSAVLPITPTGIVRAPTRIRTWTRRVLSALPLPLGYRGWCADGLPARVLPRASPGTRTRSSRLRGGCSRPVELKRRVGRVAPRGATFGTRWRAGPVVARTGVEPASPT